MARGNTRAKAASGRSVGRLGRGRAGRALAPLFWAVACVVAVACSDPAAAQVPGVGTQVTVTNAVTGNTILNNPVYDGANGPGYFVASGGTLTINNSTLQNFTTTGGSGSGGGLGAGGAIFIDTGGSVTLNNVNFSHNTAVGGTGGTNSYYGGALNNIQAVPAPNPSDPTGPPMNGTNGVNGTIWPDDQYQFGDGKGNGVPGCCDSNGGNATNGFGGNGGTGGPGTNGWSSNPVASQNLTIAQLNTANASIGLGLDVADLAIQIASAAADIADSAQPLEDPLAPTDAAENAANAIVTALGIVNDAVNLTAQIESQILAQGALDSWNKLYAAGLAGNGGSGEAGGNGGAGSYGFGGGAGGAGGAYGLAVNPVAQDGTGGNGGLGGAGGFGGGGGAGGYAFGTSQSLCGAAGCNSVNGTPGPGGIPGFGGGVGSTGGIINGDTQCNIAVPGIACGGGGGDGYGGAIFVNSGASLTIEGNSTFNGNSAIGGGSLNGGSAGGAAGTDLFMMQGALVVLAPGAGDVITFNGTIADNSTASIGAPTTAQVAGYPTSGGAFLTLFAGQTVFNGANTYSGETIIIGGAFNNLADNALTDPALLNTATNLTGPPDYTKTDGSLQAADGIGLPTSSNLNFSGPGLYTGGVLEIPGVVHSNGVVQPTTFTRYISPQANPDGGSNPGGVQWTGSGGFAALNAPLTVTLSGGAPLTWGMNGFVPSGYSLMFGAATSNNMVTFTNPIDISGGTIAAGTAASILVANNGNMLGSTAEMSGVISGTGDLSIGGGGFNGILILAAAETYTGTTAINSGALVLGPSASISNSSNVVDNGILDISPTTGVSIATLSGNGGVFLGAQTLTITNAASTFSGIIADGGIAGGTGGNLTIAGGTEILSGINTYTGLTTINPGATLTLTGLGSIAQSSDVVDNGTFDITQTTIGAMIMTLSGSGTADIGSKVLIVTNASTPFNGALNGDGTGGVVVTGGTLTLNGTINNIGSIVLEPGTALHASSTANAGLFNAATNTSTPIVVVPAVGSPIDVFTGSVHVIGALDIENVTTPELIILLGDSLVGVGSVNIPTVVQSSGTNAPGDAPGPIVYTAPITHIAGSNDVVEIDGLTSSFGINASTPSCTAPNGCAGDFSTEVVYGTAQPPGYYTYTAGGTLVPTMTGWGSPGPDPSKFIALLGESFVIVEAEGGVLGSFSGMTEPPVGVSGVSGGLQAGTRLDALYWPSPTTPYANSSSWPLSGAYVTSTTGAITLYVTPANYQNLTPFGVNLTPNQSQVGGAINALRGPPGVANNVDATIDLAALYGQPASALAHDFDTLSGEPNADAVHGAFQMMDQFLELMIDPSVSGRNGSFGSAALGFVSDEQDILPAPIASAYDSVMPTQPLAAKTPDFDQRWNEWGSAFGGGNMTNGDPTGVGTHSMTADAYGFAGGLDHHFTPNTFFGVAISGGGTNWNVSESLGSGRSEAFQLGLYAKTLFGPGYLADSFAFGNHWMTTDRYAFTGEHLRATFDAQNYGARVEAGLNYDRQWFHAAPYAAFQAQVFHTPNYSENDLSGGALGLFGLNYDSGNATDLSTELGARFESVRSLSSGMQVALHTRFAWEHDWADNPQLTATFESALLSGSVSGAPVGFLVSGAAFPHDSAIVSAGADLHVTPRLSVGAKFDGDLALTAQTYQGSATMRYSW